MGRTTPEQRKSITDAVKRGINKKLVAEVFNTSIKTVHKWYKRTFSVGRTSFKDKSRKPRETKITIEVELAILAMRTLFRWGTARIQQGLTNLPDYAKKALQNYVEDINLSRTAINNVLKRHKLNGYFNKGKKWKFFRAKKPNELWQLDPKGPFRVKGKRYWFVVCIDDYSRYMILSEQIENDPTCEQMQEMLKPYIKKYHPDKILTDNKPFKEGWDKWCKDNNIEPLHAHPYYPQDKGKVERAIRNISEEFIYIIRKFPEWLNGFIKKYREWYNTKRFHRGILNYPEKLFLGS